MAYQATFKRYEIKYILTQAQKQRLLEYMASRMALDQYGRTTIRNLYYDTDTYRLIRHSMEKPVYKEKLRLRSYTCVSQDTPIFVELKKKYKGVVYKRRLSMPEQQAIDWIGGSCPMPADNQISREIDYFIRYYRTLKPVVFLSYEREAYYCRCGSDLRITFDDRILCRQTSLSLESQPDGIPLLEDGKVLMEIKTAGAIPLWLTEFLSREGIFKTSFSKYGTAYAKIIYPNRKGDHLYA